MGTLHFRRSARRSARRSGDPAPAASAVPLLNMHAVICVVIRGSLSTAALIINDSGPGNSQPRPRGPLRARPAREDESENG